MQSKTNGLVLLANEPLGGCYNKSSEKPQRGRGNQKNRLEEEGKKHTTHDSQAFDLGDWKMAVSFIKG